MQKMPLSLTTRLIRALRRHAIDGLPHEATLEGYKVRVRGVDLRTGDAASYGSPSIEVWYGSFSHAAPFEILDSSWPDAQWNMLQMALSQCLNLGPRRDQRRWGLPLLARSAG